MIELVLRLQRPAKTSRTSSKSPTTDRKERRDQTRPGGAKPGHEGHRRVMSEFVEKPKAQHIPIEVSAIIHQPEFEAVAATLKANNPRTTPARVVTGPILLTGLATCATCSGPMTMRTGTSKSGRV